MNSEYESYASSRTFESSFFETLPRFDDENTINASVSSMKYPSDAYLEQELEKRRKLVKGEKKKPSKKDKKKQKEQNEERIKTEKFLTYLNSSVCMENFDMKDFDDQNKENEIPSEKERNLSIKNDYKQPVILCKGCQNLLAYKSYIQFQKEDFSVLKAIYNYKIDEFANNEHCILIFCNVCDSEIGIKIKNEFYIYSSIIEEKPCSLRIGLFSLKSELLESTQTLLHTLNQPLGLELKISTNLLSKSSLKTFKLKESYDGCILLHKNEGRLLLVDKNGFYNEVITEVFQQTMGNFLLVLTNLSQQEESQFNIESTETDIMSQSIGYDNPKIKPLNPLSNVNMNNNKDIFFHTNKINTLAKEGGQPFLELLSKHFKILTIDDEFNFEQKDFLTSFLHKCLYKSIISKDFTEYNPTLKQEFNHVNKANNKKYLYEFLVKKYALDEKIINEITREKSISEGTGKLGRCVIF